MGDAGQCADTEQEDGQRFGLRRLLAFKTDLSSF